MDRDFFILTKLCILEVKKCTFSIFEAMLVISKKIKHAIKLQ